jgi:hypothetical protein
MCTSVGRLIHLSEQARGTAGRRDLVLDLKARRRRAMAMAQRHSDFAASSKGGLGLGVHD